MSPVRIKRLLYNSSKISSKILASLGEPEWIKIETGHNVSLSRTTVTV